MVFAKYIRVGDGFTSIVSAVAPISATESSNHFGDNQKGADANYSSQYDAAKVYLHWSIAPDSRCRMRISLAIKFSNENIRPWFGIYNFLIFYIDSTVSWSVSKSFNAIWWGGCVRVIVLERSLFGSFKWAFERNVWWEIMSTGKKPIATTVHFITYDGAKVLFTKMLTICFTKLTFSKDCCHILGLPHRHTPARQ